MSLDWELTEIENLLHELARERRDDDGDDDLAATRPIDARTAKPRRHLRLV